MERGERQTVKASTAAIFVPVVALFASACTTTVYPQEAGFITVSNLPQIAEVDRRFLSYNIEMVQVTGGRFWAPYGAPTADRYRYRPPTDFSDPRLMAMARHLSPAFIRVSGTWANTTYVEHAGERATRPPPGFGQVLSRSQWEGLVNFARALDAPIVTSFAASEGARDAQGVWTTDQAGRLLNLTREAGGKIHAAEFLNEPSLIRAGGLPDDYDSSTFGRDFAIFARWARSSAPDMMLLGPGNLGEETVDAGVAENLMAPGGAMATERLLAETAAGLDGVSWHFYGGVSPRCGGGEGITSADAALSDEWLDRTLIEYDAMARLRDQHASGKPLWLTETAQAACGGSPWAAGFRDTFRYLNQLGQLARHGVSVVMHNTLNASEYGLIDAETMNPRPNYWASVLWQRTMGQVVLEPSVTRSDGVRLFAHCLPGNEGGVGLLLLNPHSTSSSLQLQGNGLAWVMQADNMDDGSVSVNGIEPDIAEDGSIAGLSSIPVHSAIELPALSIAFVAMPDAENDACRR